MKTSIYLFILCLMTSGLYAGSADFDHDVLPLLEGDPQLLTWIQGNLDIVPHTTQGIRVRQDFIEGIPQEVLKKSKLTRWAPYRLQVRTRTSKKQVTIGLSVSGPNEFWLLRRLARKKLTKSQLAQTKLPVSLSFSKANERSTYGYDECTRPLTEVANFEFEIKPWLKQAKHLLTFLEEHFVVIKSLGANCHRHIASFVTADELVSLPSVCAPFLLTVRPRKKSTQATFDILLTGPTVIEPAAQKVGAYVTKSRGFILTLFSSGNGPKTMKLLRTIKKAE